MFADIVLKEYKALVVTDRCIDVLQKDSYGSRGVDAGMQSGR